MDDLELSQSHTPIGALPPDIIGLVVAVLDRPCVLPFALTCSYFAACVRRFTVLNVELQHGTSFPLRVCNGKHYLMLPNHSTSELLDPLMNPPDSCYFANNWSKLPNTLIHRSEKTDQCHFTCWQGIRVDPLTWQVVSEDFTFARHFVSVAHKNDKAITRCESPLAERYPFGQSPVSGRMVIDLRGTPFAVMDAENHPLYTAARVGGFGCVDPYCEAPVAGQLLRIQGKAGTLPDCEITLELLPLCTEAKLFRLHRGGIVSGDPSVPTLFDRVETEKAVVFQQLHEEDRSCQHNTVAFFEDGSAHFEYTTESWDSYGTYTWSAAGKIVGTYTYDPESHEVSWHVTFEDWQDGDEVRQRKLDDRFKTLISANQDLATSPSVSYDSYRCGDVLHLNPQRSAKRCAVPHRGELVRK
eukprot:TRINITY_DN4001_c0_g1_i1.p1 TRINITY_DN4001_c0_g1~~TRINITY_DN4001_c0_g1_i1.p1  ORF type:complete len:413 (+),score=73.08 TRINITY_DN4001_c0_g1_i1:21-1259(+)